MTEITWKYTYYQQNFNRVVQTENSNWLNLYCKKTNSQLCFNQCWNYENLVKNLKMIHFEGCLSARKFAFCSDCSSSLISRGNVRTMTNQASRRWICRWQIHGRIILVWKKNNAAIVVVFSCYKLTQPNPYFSKA